MALDPAIAFRIGRPTLGRQVQRPVSPAVGTTSDSGSANLGKNLGVSFQFAYGGTSLGRLSAGIAGVIVIALVGFYLWTRAHQA